MFHDHGKAPDRPAWLVLLYQAPARPSSLRVRVWRRLQSIGAVQIRQSAWVLPNREQPREDLEWLKSEIEGLGGSVTLLAADNVDAAAHGEIVDAFRVSRAPDVAALVKRSHRWLQQAGKRATGDARRPGPFARAGRALVEAWESLQAITFFDTPGAAEMEDLVQKIAQHAAGRASAAVSSRRLDRAAFAGRRWVTRPRPGVDRMASAWLIRRFIDPRATFEFADRPGADHVPFDMYGGEFGHHGDFCTFEVLADRFGIRDRAVQWIARLVHDIDLREERFNEPETAGLARMIDGLRQSYASDIELLERGIALFEAMANGLPPAAPERPATSPRRKRTRS